MATNLNQPPRYDEAITCTDKQGRLMGMGRFTSIWTIWITSLKEFLDAFISGAGIDPPHLTTAERDAQTAIPDGRIIYNTTLGTLQYRKAGVWTSI